MARVLDPAFRRRVASALVLVPVVLGLTVWGGLAFVLLVAVATAVMAWEWHRLASAHRSTRAGGIYAGVVALAAVLGALLLLELERPLLALLVLFAASAGAALGAHQLRLPVRWSALGVLYLGLPALALVWLREGESGLIALVWLLAVVWATDVFAYLVGRRVGGPRLAPAISPGKTWSGLAGGIAGAAVIGATVGLAAGSSRLGHAAGLGAVLAVLSQAGDLLESRLKRLAGVKDSSALIPGHGGVLDRLDGLMAAAPALALWLLVAGGGAAPWR